MKLQDRLPCGVTVDGKFYKMDFSFRNVLRMIEVLDDNDLMPGARAYNALHCLCKHPKNVFNVLEAVKDILFTAPRKKESQRVTDWVQDAGLIRSAFRQVYGIDLWRDNLHWIEFTELLNAIPEGNRYTEIVSIRARPMPEPTKWNQKEREWLLRAKSDYALDLTEDEIAKQQQLDINRIADVMIAWAGGAKNG